MRPEPEMLLECSRFRVVRHTQKLPDGRTHVRETVVHPGAVVILPMVSPDHVCLIRNYRIAVDETLIELPAGTISPPEDPLDTAQRELAEETGFRARSFQRLYDFWVSPGILSERIHLFLATDLAAGPTELEPGEQIETLTVPWNEAIQMIDDQRIRDAKTIVGLLYYDRLRTRGAI